MRIIEILKSVDDKFFRADSNKDADFLQKMTVSESHLISECLKLINVIARYIFNHLDSFNILSKRNVSQNEKLFPLRKKRFSLD